MVGSAGDSGVEGVQPQSQHQHPSGRMNRHADEAGEINRNNGEKEKDTENGDSGEAGKQDTDKDTDKEKGAVYLASDKLTFTDAQVERMCTISRKSVGVRENTIHVCEWLEYQK